MIEHALCDHVHPSRGRLLGASGTRWNQLSRDSSVMQHRVRPWQMIWPTTRCWSDADHTREPSSIWFVSVWLVRAGGLVVVNGVADNVLKEELENTGSPRRWGGWCDWHHHGGQPAGRRPGCRHGAPCYGFIFCPTSLDPMSPSLRILVV